nr:MAG TPA: hypothetical protein [Caudoviricetes sp.]
MENCKISGVLYNFGKVLYIGVSIGDFTQSTSELHLLSLNSTWRKRG